jgi:large subunit ribosomal protein L21e
MTHSYGYKSKTRHLFAKKFRKHGVPPVSTLLRTYKVGQYVDVVADPSVRAGMPHKYYHGRTGIIWNVTPRGVGVIVNKPVRNRILRKRICVRAEHVRPSACRAAFVAKQKAFAAFQAAKKAGKAEIKKIASKRGASIVKPAKVETLARVKADLDKFMDY